MGSSILLKNLGRIMGLDKQEKSFKNIILVKQWRRIEKTILVFAISMVILVYWRWFLPGIITWGDWGPQNQETMLEMFSRLFPYSCSINGGSFYRTFYTNLFVPA